MGVFTFGDALGVTRAHSPAIIPGYPEDMSILVEIC